MKTQIAKYNEVTFIGRGTETETFSFEWDVFSQNGGISYCGRVIAETLERAMLRAWVEIENSEWFKLGRGRVKDDFASGWYVDWECKQELHCGRGGF